MTCVSNLCDVGLFMFADAPAKQEAASVFQTCYIPLQNMFGCSCKHDFALLEPCYWDAMCSRASGRNGGLTL